MTRGGATLIFSLLIEKLILDQISLLLTIVREPSMIVVRCQGGIFESREFELQGLTDVWVTRRGELGRECRKGGRWDSLRAGGSPARDRGRARASCRGGGPR
jgi:hypothetical protein